MKPFLLTLNLTLACVAGNAHAQALLHQPTNSSAPQPMPADLLSSLDDPFFNIIIKADPQPKDVDSIIAAVRAGGGSSNFDSFIVGEQIGRKETRTECGPANRRLVISFSGTHNPTGDVLDGNVFLSVFIDPSNPVGPIETMAWDKQSGAYNYYKIEGGTWRFRNSSNDLSTATPDTVSDGCLACHVNGGPVMKEFTFPWNHWHGLSNTFIAGYLNQTNPTWPISNSNVLGVRLKGAQKLEEIVHSALQRFIDGLIDRQIEIQTDNSVAVSGLPNLLDSLFQPTELNLGSSNSKSGLDKGGLTERATNRMNIPDSFFVNIMQMRDIGLPAFEGVSLISSEFTPGELGLSVDEYETLITDANQSTECMPGQDTLFSWFGPEPSEFDRRMIARLMNKGVIDANFIAAALAIDVGNPLFSMQRASLLKHVPETVSASSIDQLPDKVRAAVIQSLDNTDSKTPEEQDFLALLQAADALTNLDARVRELIVLTQAKLRDPAQRSAHLQTLFDRLQSNREAFRNSPISRPLNEFRGLIPTVE